MSSSAMLADNYSRGAMTSQPKKPFKSPPPPMPSTAQMAKEELINGKKACPAARAKSTPPPPEPPGIGERFAGPWTRELSSGPPVILSVVMPPPGVCAVPPQAIHPSPHPEEPLISLKADDSLKFEDLRREINAMTMSVETAESSGDWMLKKEDIGELINAEVAV